MADSSVSNLHDQFICSFCTDLPIDPVTIPCGHSYCMSCLRSFWDQEDQSGVYSCHQCSQTFKPRPAARKNITLTTVIEELKQINLQPAQFGDVPCDACTEKKYKAIKFCQVCLSSYCPMHLEQHQSFFQAKKHDLMEPDPQQLQEMICPEHDKLREIYCRTDQQCICYLCTMDEHRGHETVSAVAERTEKQDDLVKTQEKCHQMIKEKKKVFEDLSKAVESHKFSAQKILSDSEKTFTELVQFIEKSFSEMLQQIQLQEFAEVIQAEKHLELLEKEIDDLKKRDTELEQLVQTDHHIQFLKSFQSLTALLGSTNPSNITVSHLLCCKTAEKSVSDLNDKLMEICNEKTEMFKKEKLIEIILFEPKTREQCVQYQHQLTLDSNTVNRNIRLFEENTTIKFSHKKQQYPDHPDRFENVQQVLCRESVSGRCYYEVKWVGKVDISVSYKSICRKGGARECQFGYNNQSWSLLCSKSCSFCHNNKVTSLPVEPSSKIGVYVDHGAGILCFYSVHSNTLTLIYKVQTKFTQPLYPGFRVDASPNAQLMV